MIILDTDVVIEILDRRSEKGDEALQRIRQSGEDVAITAINLHEILYGLQKFERPVKEAMLLPTLNCTGRDAARSSKIELEEEKTGKPICRADAMIAAITINNGATLFTLDSKHFSPLRSLGLKLFT
jgi:tRNA(fMet)-specific endonuclease VapC